MIKNVLSSKSFHVIIFTIVVLIVAFLFYGATALHPLLLDDYTYRNIFATNILIEDVGDIIESQIIHWHKWGGRFFAHFLVQFFLMIDDSWHHIANTICYISCCTFLALLISKENFLRNWVIIALSFWVLMPSPGGTMFWLTGSFNYLWPSCLSIIFVYLLLQKKTGYQVAALMLALFAGNSHESLSLGMCFAMAMYAVLFPRQSKLFYIALAVYFIGLLSNIVAPGNFVRASSIASADISEPGAFIWQYVKNFLKVGYRLTFNFSDWGVQCATLMWLCASFVCLYARKNGNSKYRILACFLLGAVATLLLNVASGTAYSRAVFGFCFLSYVSFMYSLALIKPRYTYIFAIATVLLNVFYIPYAYKTLSLLNTNMQNVIEACQNNRSVAVLAEGSELFNKNRLSGVPISPCSLMNWSCEDFFGVEDISLISQRVATTLDENRERLANLPIHSHTKLNDYVRIVRLDKRPRRIDVILKKPSLSPDASVLEKINLWIDKFRYVGTPCYVICYDNRYYAYWVLPTVDSIQVRYCGKDCTVITALSEKAVTDY